MQAVRAIADEAKEREKEEEEATPAVGSVLEALAAGRAPQAIANGSTVTGRLSAPAPRRSRSAELMQPTSYYAAFVAAARYTTAR